DRKPPILPPVELAQHPRARGEPVVGITDTHLREQIPAVRQLLRVEAVGSQRPPDAPVPEPEEEQEHPDALIGGGESGHSPSFLRVRRGRGPSRVAALPPRRSARAAVARATADPRRRGADPPLRIADPPFRGADPPLRFADPPLRFADPPLRIADPPLRSAD